MERKSILNTDIDLPKISMLQSHNFITETNTNTNNDVKSSFSGYNKIKGVLDFKRIAGRKNYYKLNKNPSSFDYKPNFDFGNRNKINNKDEDYNKKKFKLMKMMKNYECKSEYQVVDF